MRAGSLDRKIELQTWTEAESAIGEPIKTFKRLAYVFARVVPINGNEVLKSGRPIASKTAKFIIRYRNDLTTVNRIVYAGENWNILSMAELGRGEGFELLAEVIK